MSLGILSCYLSCYLASNLIMQNKLTKTSHLNSEISQPFKLQLSILAYLNENIL